MALLYTTGLLNIESSNLLLVHDFQTRRRTMDFIVAYYHPHDPNVTTITSWLLDTAYAKQQDMRVFVYVKHPNASLVNLFPRLSSNFSGRIIVQRLPNLGREGGTYLHHLVYQYDDLADFLVFTQETPHHDVLTPRYLEVFGAGGALTASSGGNLSKKQPGFLGMGYTYLQTNMERMWSVVFDCYAHKDCGGLVNRVCARNLECWDDDE
jgi:hypothetical protein